MSLEQAIQDNTAAVRDLIATLCKKSTVPAAQTGEQTAEPEKAARPARAKKEEKAPVASEQPVATSSPRPGLTLGAPIAQAKAAAPAQAAQAPAHTLEGQRERARNAVIEFAKTYGNEQAAAVFEGVHPGARKLSHIPDEKLGDLTSAIDAYGKEAYTPATDNSDLLS